MTLALGMGVWLCFDSYVTSNEFTHDKFETDEPKLVNFSYVVEGVVRSDIIRMRLESGYYDPRNGCYFHYYPNPVETVYYKKSDA